MKLVHRLLFYSMSGIFTEVVFTSLKTLYYHKDYELHGNTQLWVIFIYAFGGLLFEQLYKSIQNTPLRVTLYLILVYILEYTGGWLLLQTLGRCPWHYHEPGNIHGLIQFRYAPAWLLFVIIANNGIYYTLNYEFSRSPPHTMTDSDDYTAGYVTACGVAMVLSTAPVWAAGTVAWAICAMIVGIITSIAVIVASFRAARPAVALDTLKGDFRITLCFPDEDTRYRCAREMASEGMNVESNSRRIITVRGDDARIIRQICASYRLDDVVVHKTPTMD